MASLTTKPIPAAIAANQPTIGMEPIAAQDSAAKTLIIPPNFLKETPPESKEAKEDSSFPRMSPKVPPTDFASSFNCCADFLVSFICCFTSLKRAETFLSSSDFFTNSSEPTGSFLRSRSKDPVSLRRLLKVSSTCFPLMVRTPLVVIVVAIH